jgi:hypothetical protein
LASAGFGGSPILNLPSVRGAGILTPKPGMTMGLDS